MCNTLKVGLITQSRGGLGMNWKDIEGRIKQNLYRHTYRHKKGNRWLSRPETRDALTDLDEFCGILLETEDVCTLVYPEALKSSEFGPVLDVCVPPETTKERRQASEWNSVVVVGT